MNLDVIQLTKKLVSFKSVTRWSNREISDYLHQVLITLGCEIERQEYVDPNGEIKVNLIGKLGHGNGGIAFCSHNDTVPGQEEDWDPYDPIVLDGNLFGRGSCDMKGPLAATIVAAASFDTSKLKKPIYIVITADEEIGLVGAKYMAEHSPMLANSGIEYGIIAEPTTMIPVYSHKGFAYIEAQATGRAAHSSTGLGESALIKAAPFIGYLAELDQTLQSDQSFQNEAYEPTHHSMNFTVDTGEAALNVMAPRAMVRVALRAMPNARSEELIRMIADKAESYGMETLTRYNEALFAPVSAEIVQSCVEFTGRQPETVPYGTDGTHLKKHIDQLVVLGPGDIGVAHTVGEFVPVAQLHEAVDVYSKLINRFCVD